LFGACGCVEEILGKLIWCIVLEEGKGITDGVKLKLEIPKQGEFIYKSNAVTLLEEALKKQVGPANSVPNMVTGTFRILLSKIVDS